MNRLFASPVSGRRMYKCQINTWCMCMCVFNHSHDVSWQQITFNKCTFNICWSLRFSLKSSIFILPQSERASPGIESAAVCLYKGEPHPSSATVALQENSLVTAAVCQAGSVTNSNAFNVLASIKQSYTDLQPLSVPGKKWEPCEHVWTIFLLSVWFPPPSMSSALNSQSNYERTTNNGISFRSSNLDFSDILLFKTHKK